MMSETLVLTEPADPAADSAVLVAVDRATAELRRGAMVLMLDAAGHGALVLAAETASDVVLAEMARLAPRPALALSSRRAAVLGFPTPGDGVAAIALDGIVAHSGAVQAGAVQGGVALLRRLADPTADAPTESPADPSADPDAAPGGVPNRPLADAVLAEPRAARFAAAAVELAKQARLLPAAMVAPLAPAGIGGWPDLAHRYDLLVVTVAAVSAYANVAAHSLRRAGEARVPLEAAENARIVAFRPSDGGVEHLAIVIGTPAPDQPVLARLHSECFTGDLLGSLRCDCGDQLRDAIAAIGRHGSGLLLYLAQEGRGIGLVNKLRAYELQDRGADTVEANRQLGFDPDERIYRPAAEMLRQLGFARVRLMTNNPAKVAGLGRCGITVTERVPHVIPANGHNAGYLRTKATQLGHLF